MKKLATEIGLYEALGAKYGLPECRVQDLAEKIRQASAETVGLSAQQILGKTVESRVKRDEDRASVLFAVWFGREYGKHDGEVLALAVALASDQKHAAAAA